MRLCPPRFHILYTRLVVGCQTACQKIVSYDRETCPARKCRRREGWRGIVDKTIPQAAFTKFFRHGTAALDILANCAATQSRSNLESISLLQNHQMQVHSYSRVSNVETSESMLFKSLADDILDDSTPLPTPTSPRAPRSRDDGMCVQQCLAADWCGETTT